MINSKQKGKRGELEFVKFCNEKTPFSVRRTAQYNGKEQGSLADVIGINGLHIEVKRDEKLNVHKALQQAIRDNSNKNDIPIVAHRKNGQKWMITIDAEDFLKIYESYYIKEVENDG